MTQNTKHDFPYVFLIHLVTFNLVATSWRLPDSGHIFV